MTSVKYREPLTIVLGEEGVEEIRPGADLGGLNLDHDYANAQIVGRPAGGLQGKFGGQAGFLREGGGKPVKPDDPDLVMWEDQNGLYSGIGLYTDFGASRQAAREEPVSFGELPKLSIPRLGKVARSPRANTLEELDALSAKARSRLGGSPLQKGVHKFLSGVSSLFSTRSGADAPPPRFIPPAENQTPANHNVWVERPALPPAGSAKALPPGHKRLLPSG